MDNNIVDLPFKGPRFNWCNNRKGAERVYRLYIVPASDDWFLLYPDTYPIQISDHAPIEVDINLTKCKGERPYRLKAWSLKNEECLMLVLQKWGTEVRGSAAYKLTRRLAAIKGEIKKWSWERKKDWARGWEDFDEEISTALENYSDGSGDVEKVNDINDIILLFAKVATQYWKQRAKIRWTVDGEICTLYFFNWVKGRGGSNKILGLKGASGVWSFELNEIKAHFLDFYKTNLCPTETSTTFEQFMEENASIFSAVKRKLTEEDVIGMGKNFTA